MRRFPALLLVPVAAFGLMACGDDSSATPMGGTGGGSGGSAGEAGSGGSSGMGGNAGAGGSMNTLRITPIADQVVTRNFITPRSFDVEVAAPELDTAFSIAITSNRESVVPSSTSECPSPPCAFTFTPDADRNATAEVDVTVTSGDLRGECPTLPARFTRLVPINEGTWTAQLEVIRGTSTELSDIITLTVLAPNLTPAGTISLQEVDPNMGAAAIVVRDFGTPTNASEVDIVGENLDNNPFLEVELAPIPFGEPKLASNSALDVRDWCRTPVEITGRGPLPGGLSRLTVRLPELPLEARTTCGPSAGATGSIFAKNWRFIIRDRWIRPERVHSLWAIPSQRDVPWFDAPPFTVVKPPYPDIDGFGFNNFETDATYREFLTVYGNNAYLCVGAFGVCATRLPDPLYHLIWWPIYKLAINSSGGSCNGMSATSLLMAREALQPEDFDPQAHFPVALTSGDDPSRFDDPDFCTPVCSPPRPDNLWATIRMNHGVQISREFLFHILETLGAAVFDPNDLTSIKGVPRTTIEQVRDDPDGHVVCFFEPGNGHCVTPYRVEGDRMFVYDNNASGDESRFIDFDDDYDYPARRANDSSPNSGNAIIAFPISIWENSRHLIGLKELVLTIGGVDYLYLLVVGDANLRADDDNGGRWGYEDDGTFSDSLRGAVSVPMLGPNEGAPSKMPLLIPMNETAPTLQMVAEGGSYLFFAGHDGHLLQLEASDAEDGDRDEIRVNHDADRLDGFDFVPARNATHIVPRVGLELGEEESGVFQWLGLRVPAGRAVGFDADQENQAVALRNDTGAETQHVLALDYGSGDTEASGRMVYGPFEVPTGATHRVVASEWPAVDEVRSEIDMDRDGQPESVEMVRGRALPALEDLATEADLSLEFMQEPETFAEGIPGAYELAVRNDGPNDATSVALDTAIEGGSEVAMVSTSRGRCDATPIAVRCDLGSLAVGENATVQYEATPAAARAPTQVATVFGAQGDPDWTNNSVTRSATASLTNGNGGAGGNGADNGGGGCRAHTGGTGAPITALVFVFAIWLVARRRRA